MLRGGTCCGDCLRGRLLDRCFIFEGIGNQSFLQWSQTSSTSMARYSSTNARRWRTSVQIAPYCLGGVRSFCCLTGCFRGAKKPMNQRWHRFPGCPTVWFTLLPQSLKGCNGFSRKQKPLKSTAKKNSESWRCQPSANQAFVLHTAVHGHIVTWLSSIL